MSLSDEDGYFSSLCPSIVDAEKHGFVSFCYMDVRLMRGCDVIINRDSLFWSLDLSPNFLSSWVWVW